MDFLGPFLSRYPIVSSCASQEEGITHLLAFFPAFAASRHSMQTDATATFSSLSARAKLTCIYSWYCQQLVNGQAVLAADSGWGGGGMKKVFCCKGGAGFKK